MFKNIPKKLLIRLGVMFVIVTLISAAVIYFTFDIRAIRHLTLFKWWSVLLAFGSLAIGLTFDGMRLVTLARITGADLPLHHVVKVVLSNYFLALVTPGASGGAIAQVMFMKKAGVPVPKATMVVLVRTVMSIMFLIIMVPFFIKYDQGITSWINIWVIGTVSVIFTAIPVVTILLMRTNIPEGWIYRLTKNISHIRRRQIYLWYNDFRSAAMVMGRRPWMVARAFVESGLSLLFIYGTVPSFFLGLDFDFNFPTVMGRMLLLNLVLYFSPTPGGSGVAEAGFLVLFARLVPDGTVGILAVMWRFAAEYVPFMLGAVICIRAIGANAMELGFKDGDAGQLPEGVASQGTSAPAETMKPPTETTTKTTNN